MKVARDAEVDRILESLAGQPDEVVAMVHGWISGKLGKPQEANPYKGDPVWERGWYWGWERFHRGDSPPIPEKN